MKFSTRSRYGLHLLRDIAIHAESGPVSISEIASRHSMSLKYTEKIIRQLRQGGWLSSTLGARGGYQLTRQASAMPLGEIVRYLEDSPLLLDCQKLRPGCPRCGVCLTRSLWQEALEAMYAKLDSFTLADLVRDTQLCPVHDPPSTYCCAPHRQ